MTQLAKDPFTRSNHEREREKYLFATFMKYCCSDIMQREWHERKLPLYSLFAQFVQGVISLSRLILLHGILFLSFYYVRVTNLIVFLLNYYVDLLTTFVLTTQITLQWKRRATIT